MIEGIYDIGMKSPMGNVSGTLQLKQNGNQITGFVEALGMQNDLTGEITTNNCFKVYGVLKTAMGRFDYNADGEVMGNNVSIKVNTKAGVFSINGKRR